MADQIKRLNYFKHQFLRASDFIDEQKYHIEMRRRHNSSLHTWGIAGGGLKVTFAQGATAVKVSEGMAIDSQGREIILTNDKTVELSGIQPLGSPVFIVISYAEKKTDPSTETGAEGDTRWTEEPALVPMTARPSDVGTQLILALVRRTGATVTGVDETERRAAGVETGELTIRSLRLSRPDVDAAAWPRLSCSAPNQAAVENSSLKLDANREIFFADNGQIRSLDNNHRLVFNRQANRMELHEFGDILFLTGNPAQTEKMRVAASGNVGIGVPAPTVKLHVDGSGLFTGSLTWGSAASRTETKDDAGAQASRSGFFETAAPVNYYAGANGWQHLIESRHSNNGNNFALQIAGSFHDQNLYMRKTSNSATTAWSRFVLMNSNGNVGIKTETPNFPLSFPDVLGDKISLWGQGANHYGFGIQGSLLQIHTDGASSDVAFGFGSSAAFKETMRIKGNGNVGIGVVNPQAGLHIESNQPNIRIDSTGDRGVIQMFRKGTALWDFGVGRDGTNTDFWFGDFISYRLVIQKGTGFVGIGSTDPKRILHVEGNEIHSGGAGGGYSFAERDNGGPYVETGINGSRWVLYAAQNTARLWTAGDRFVFGREGNLTINGALRVGGSDIYFTETDHDHTGHGNALHNAAIENAKGYNALMILGRAVTVNPLRRVVKVWDYLEVNGDLTVTGTLRAPSKQGFVVDDFINRHGDALEQGDVVVISENQTSLYYGLKGNLPVPEVDIAQGAYDKRVCGIVNELLVQPPESSTPTPSPDAPDSKAPKKASKGKAAHAEAASQPQLSPMQSFAPEQLENLDTTKVGTGQFGLMVTHGAYAFCKVDADIAPVVVGDLLTTSPTKGHAQKVLDPSKAMGAVIGKALGSLKKGKGKVPILVTLQ